MSGWTEDVDKKARKVLGACERRIDDLESAMILRAARKDFGLPPINLYILESNRRSYHAVASVRHRSGKEVRSIKQAPSGMTVHTILHEIAHHMPGGMNHGAEWVWNYYSLVSWFRHQDSQNRFAVDMPELELD